MGLFCLDMLAIALELSQTRPAYEAIATKFFEHFVAIAHAINGICGQIGLWDPVDGFYYDVIRSRRRPARAPAGPLVRGPDPAVRGPGDRAGDAGAAARSSGAGWSGTCGTGRRLRATSAC